MSVVECPSQVTRNPDAAGTASRAAASVTTGNGQIGVRISLPKSHCRSAPAHVRPAMRCVRSVFTNLPSLNSGDARSCAGSGLPPNAAKWSVDSHASTARAIAPTTTVANTWANTRTRRRNIRVRLAHEARGVIARSTGLGRSGW